MLAQDAQTVRPDPGLARGPFAAPPAFFYALLGVTFVALALWLGRRRLTRRSKRS